MKNTKESFYLEYEKLVYEFLWDFFKGEKDRKLAKEMVSELFSQVWIRVFRNFDKYMVKSEDHIKNSLRVTAHNVFIDYRKKLKREQEKTVPIEEIMWEMISSDTIDTALFTPGYMGYLKEALKTLSREDRYLIWEYYFSGREGKETAQLLDMNYNTLRTKVGRICKELRAEMERLMKDGGDLDD